MQLGINSAINFKSDYYGFKKLGTWFFPVSIKTDDTPEPNKDLLLRIKDYKDKIHGDFPMVYDGKYYTHNFSTYIEARSYKILNKKQEQEEKKFSAFEMSKILNGYDRMSTGRPMEKIVAKGTTEGVLVKDLDNIPQDIPVIVIIDKLEGQRHIYDTLSTFNSNVLGIILNNVIISDLTHAANTTSQYFDVASVIYDDKKYNELKKLAGEKIRISNENGQIEYSVTDKIPDLRKFKFKTPNIPILEEETKLLDFSELTRKNSGEKAYRLGVMQKLLKEGYLSDIEIPAGFVIPVGYINKIYDYIREPEDEIEQEKRLLFHPLNSELEKFCHRYGIDNVAYIRSAFNAEDLPDYPTAGIYESEICGNFRQFVQNIDSVVTSKDDSPAQKSRERFGIDDSLVQPCIIVQNYVHTDYPFTLYTDSPDGKLKIEMLTNKINGGRKSPATITYDRKSGEIKLETLPYIRGEYLIKDTGEVVEQHLEKDEIQKDWVSLLAPIGIVVKNALKLEKYFGRPQDIEGGIREGKVYFWQARDIIKKVSRR